MKGVHQAFEKGVADLRAHIAYIEGEKSLFGAVLQPIANGQVPKKSPLEDQLLSVAQLATTGTFKRQFDYAAVVISLYGLFESFLEAILKSYLGALSSTTRSYGDLPEKVRERHVAATCTLLAKPDLQKYRDTVTAESLTANLHSCLSNQASFTLNVDAYTYHTANFRTVAIDDFFKSVGLSNMSQRVLKTPSFQGFLAGFDAERQKSLNSGHDPFVELNDLAERRNEVAHGSVSDLLANELLLDYARVVEAYGKSVYEIVNSEALSFEVDRHGSAPIECVDIFNDHIVCLEIGKGTTVTRGDVLVANLTGSPLPVIGGEILEIQIDNVDVAGVSALDGLKIGLRVAFKAKNNQTFRLLRR